MARRRDGGVARSVGGRASDRVELSQEERWLDAQRRPCHTQPRSKCGEHVEHGSRRGQSRIRAVEAAGGVEEAVPVEEFERSRVGGDKHRGLPVPLWDFEARGIAVGNEVLDKGLHGQLELRVQRIARLHRTGNMECG